MALYTNKQTYVSDAASPNAYARQNNNLTDSEHITIENVEDAHNQFRLKTASGLYITCSSWVCAARNQTNDYSQWRITEISEGKFCF